MCETSRVFLRWWLVVGSLLLAGVEQLLRAEPPCQHIVLVSVDGLAAQYFTDPQADLPTLRALAAQGVRARGMITSFPSVTWPSHTSLITGTHPGRHGVIGNNAFDRRTQQEVVYIGDPMREKHEAIKVPTLYDVAHAGGLSCASVLWPCCNGADTLRYMIPDTNRAALLQKYTTPGLPEELKQAGIDLGKLGEWGWNKEYSQQRDNLYTDIVIYLLKKYRINLMLVHLITPDGVEHAKGPFTPEAYEAVKQSDANLKRIWETLQEPPFAGRSSLVVVSDHGFAPVERVLRPNVLFKEHGWIEVDANNRPIKRRVWCVGQGGGAFVYILDEEHKNELLKEVRELLAAQPGVAEILDISRFAEVGHVPPEENIESPHLLLATGPRASLRQWAERKLE
ncbi:MAG: hypothetical protein KatS3mg114_1158 [Planctomycetaceae bacterium]|nr:MAG: hypothetical protein KatS3mg114_1158 [Planctomycetaceae bacterium]